MQDYIRQRVLDISKYIIDSSATVRQTANVFGVSKSTVHMVVTKQNENILTALFLPYNLQTLTMKGLQRLSAKAVSLR